MAGWVIASSRGPLGRIGEDELAEPRAVERGRRAAARPCRTPARSGRRRRLPGATTSRARRSASTIRRSRPAQESGDRALAGGDAAGEADQEEAPHYRGPVGAGLHVHHERHVERERGLHDLAWPAPAGASTSSGGASKSSSSCTCSSMRLSSRWASSSWVHPDHRDLDHVRGGALHRRVGGHALAEVAQVRVAAAQLGQVAAPPSSVIT